MHIIYLFASTYMYLSQSSELYSSILLASLCLRGGKAIHYMFSTALWYLLYACVQLIIITDVHVYNSDDLCLTVNFVSHSLQ